MAHYRNSITCDMIRISQEGGDLLLSGVLYNNFSAAIIPWLHGAVVKDLTSLIGDLEGSRFQSQ